MGIQRAGDVGNAGGIAVDELDQPLNIAQRAGDVQVALVVAEIDLHVDDDQVDVAGILPGRGQICLGRSGGNRCHVGVEQAAYPLRVIEAGKVGHWRISLFSMMQSIKCLSYT